MLNYYFINYLYRNRIILLLPLVFLFLQYMGETPTRLFVHSALFFFTLALLAVYSSLSIYLFATCCRVALAFFNMLLPIPFVLLTQARYDGDINTDQEVLFYAALLTILLQLLIWFISLFFKPPSISQTLHENNTMQHDTEDAGSIGNEKDAEQTIVASAIVQNGQFRPVTLAIAGIEDCFYIAELYGGNEVIDFKEQFLEYLETKQSSTYSYTAVCSYLKFGEYLQERQEYTVTIGPPL
jgi:hypothetical protein